MGESFLPLDDIGVGGQFIDLRFQDVATVIVKVTHRCNLDCHYCYEHITKGEDMSLAVFFHLIDQLLAGSRKKRLTILFHGGEPTLMSNEWLETAVSYAREQASLFEKELIFSMQSNLLALETEKLALLKKLEIHLSLSVDGPSTLMDQMRPRADRVEYNYQRLREVGIRPGILMTINQSNFHYFPKICRWLEEELGVDEFKANVVSAVGRGIDLPDLGAEQVFQANKDILEYMIGHGGDGVVEDNLAIELIRFFATNEERATFPQELCRTRWCGAGERVLGVTPKGKLLPCGRFQWDDADYFLGSLEEVIVSQEAWDESLVQFHDQKPESWYECDRCPAKVVCSFGCQAFIVRSKSQANIDCLPTQMRYDYYVKNWSRLAPLVDALLKRPKWGAYARQLQVDQGWLDEAKEWALVQSVPDSLAQKGVEKGALYLASAVRRGDWKAKAAKRIVRLG